MKPIIQKRDSNEKDIIRALRAAGVFVWKLDRIDLLTAWGGRIEMMEIKNLDGRGKRFTPAEIEIREELAARGVEIHVICDIDDALNVYGLAWL